MAVKRVANKANKRAPLSVAAKAGPSGEVKKVRDRAIRNSFARPDAQGDGAERPHPGSAPPPRAAPHGLRQAHLHPRPPLALPEAGAAEPPAVPRLDPDRHRLPRPAPLRRALGHLPLQRLVPRRLPRADARLDRLRGRRPLRHRLAVPHDRGAAPHPFLDRGRRPLLLLEHRLQSGHRAIGGHWAERAEIGGD